MFSRNEANEESLRGIPTECRFPSLIEEAPFDGEEHGGKGQNTFYWFFVNSKETLDKIQNTFYSNGVVAYEFPGLCSRKPYKLEENLIGQFICVEADCNGEEVWDPPVTLRTCLENVSNILSALGLTMSVTSIKKIKEENKMPELRIINLYDDDTNLLVETNAPVEKIEEAIAHKNEMLINDDPNFRCDFEEVQDFLNKAGYHFEQIGYINDIEGYLW
jgi:hypothetical protein